jgi:hypothetical protein
MVKLLFWSAGLDVTATTEPLVVTRLYRFSLAWAGSLPSSLLVLALPWPFCDAVVSAHSLDALDDLLAALS